MHNVPLCRQLHSIKICYQISKNKFYGTRILYNFSVGSFLSNLLLLLLQNELFP
jgi:hypothetical protein